MMAHDDQRQRFEALVAEVHDPLVRYLRRRASFADADDVLSDVLLTIWRRFDAVPVGAELPWCFGVARRTLANYRRGEQRRLQLVRRIETQSPLSFDAAGSDEYPELAAALSSLTDAERELIVLWAWEGLEPREIATVLDATPNAVSLRLGRAKNKLARELARQSAKCAGHLANESTRMQPA